jgi:hypothetical protein
MPIERETIVTSNGPSSGGIIAGILVAVVVLLILGLVVQQNGGFSFGGHETTVTLDVPKVSVTPAAK